MDEFVINIDATDWKEEYDHEGTPIRNFDDVISARRDRHPAQTARMALIARDPRVEDAPPDLLPMNRLLLMSGAMASIASAIAQREVTRRLKNGIEITCREYMGVVHSDDDEQTESSSDGNPGIVSIDDNKALDRALAYLQQRVPGYVMGRLKVIAVCGGDVREAADELIGKIEKMVDKLV